MWRTRIEQALHSRGDRPRWCPRRRWVRELRRRGLTTQRWGHAVTGASTFGRAIRAARLGFKPSARHGCYIRLSEPKPGDLLVEVVPFMDGDFPSSHCKYFVWWEGEDPAPLLDACEPLADIARNGPPTKPMVWHVNEEGAVIGQAGGAA